jgi:hypothetical protein
MVFRACGVDGMVFRASLKHHIVFVSMVFRASLKQHAWAREEGFAEPMHCLFLEGEYV